MSIEPYSVQVTFRKYLQNDHFSTDKESKE